MSIKQQPSKLRRTAIEAKREFVQIVIEMTMLDAALKGFEQPSLQDGCDTVYSWQQCMGWKSTPLDVPDGMAISEIFQATVA